jgi:hypothetical protein
LDRSIASVLNLPERPFEALGNRDLAIACAEFFEQLEMGPERTIITFDGEFFLADENTEEGQEAWAARLCLLNALMRPDDQMINSVVESTIPPGISNNVFGPSIGPTRPIWVARGIHRFITFQDDEDYERLTAKSTSPTHYYCLSSEISSAPGLSYSSSIEIFAWTDEWSVIMYSGDEEIFRHGAFPTVLGFALTESLPYSAGLLLAREDAFYGGNGALMNGDELLMGCWARYGEEGCESMGETLLAMSDDERSLLLKEYQSLASQELFDDLKTLELFGVDYLDVDDDIAVRSVLDTYAEVAKYKGIKAIVAMIPDEEDRLDGTKAGSSKIIRRKTNLRHK